MRIIFLVVILSLSISVNDLAQTESHHTRTICNPLNLSYRYMPDTPSRREAADPSIIMFRDDYYLFASKSGGYWWSHDLVDWNLIETNQILTEDYAPTVVAIDDTLYFLASSSKKCPVLKSGDPKSGCWQIARDSLPFTLTDPCFFLDGDSHLYLYWGCSPSDPIHGIELNPKTFDPIGTPQNFILADTKNRGWENPGDENELKQPPWIEGPSMNKFNGKYYLQYAAPGTEYKSYADGVYSSDSPLGPFTYAPVNPFSYKPGGFICGAGHGSTTKDRYGNYWHIATMTISVLHKFERRIGLFPASLDQDGNLIADAGITDRPIIIPDHKFSHTNELSPGWMLLSYRKPTRASSTLENFPSQNAVDENVRTSWCAISNARDEWIMVDLGTTYTIRALQINYSDHGTKIYSRDTSCYYQYIVESSIDMKSWKNIVDKTNVKSDSPHDYVQLSGTVKARYVRLKNKHVPDGLFSVSDFRIFGIGSGKKPALVRSLKAVRYIHDRRIVNVSWIKSVGATGYTIRFGQDKITMLYSYPVYTDTCMTLRSLNIHDSYYFSIDSFNENGISVSKAIQKIQ